MVGSRPLLVRRSALVRRSGGARHARGLCTTTPHRLQSERSERRRSRGPPRRPGRPGPGGRRGRRPGERICSLAPGRRRRRIRARAAAAGVRRVPCGARAAAVELGRHHRAAARRPLACRGPARDPAHDARLGRHAPPRPAMTFRARLLLGFGAVVLVPLTVFGLRIRAVMANRLTAEYQQRVAALVSVIRADLDRQSAGIALRLAALRDAIPSSFLARLAPDSELTVSVALPPDTSAGADPATQVVSAVTVLFVTSGDSARLLPAHIVVSHSLASLVALRRGVALSFLVAVLVTGLIALLRSEEHTSELQSHSDLVCRLLLEKKKNHLS